MALLTGLGIWIGIRISGGTAAIPTRETPEPVTSAQPDTDTGDNEEKDENEEAPPAEIPPLADDDGRWNLIVVNKQNPLPSAFRTDLETVADGVEVDARIRAPLFKMVNAAKEDGIILTLYSGYRTREQQGERFAAYRDDLISREGQSEEDAIAITGSYIAAPGESEYHTGLAVDILTSGYTEPDEGFADTHAYSWLSMNAKDYGFILRYPRAKEDITGMRFEPWQYRYVGVAAAHVISENRWSLEEYIYSLNTPVDDEEIDEDEDPGDEVDE